MWEAAAYSQNIFKVMLDPATWLIAAIFVFGMKRQPVWMRVTLALVANLAFCLVVLYWPAGESGRQYAAIATAYEFAATAIWCAISIGIRRMTGRSG